MKSISRRDLYGGSDVLRADPKKKKKPNPRKAAKRYADDWARAYCKKMYPVCVTCGKGPEQAVMQWGHLLTAAAESTRWVSYNFACQCAGCNMRHEYDPSPFTLWFIRKYGTMAYELLAATHHKPAHFKTADLIEIGDKYKRLCEEGQR